MANFGRIVVQKNFRPAIIPPPNKPPNIPPPITEITEPHEVELSLSSLSSLRLPAKELAFG